MMGVNTVRTKLLAFALGASFAGVAGSFQASYLGASTSDFFDFSISILVLIMVILGGIGNIWGAVLGAFVLTYVDKTLLPYIGQRIGDVAPSMPEPRRVQLPHLRRHPRADDAVPAAGLPAEPPARGGAERPRARRRRSAEMGVDVELDNVSVAPHGPGRDRPRSPRRRSARGGSRPVTIHELPIGHGTGALADDSLLVNARGVTKRFGGLLAVNNVDFDIPRGSIVSLIGPNGAGKTTFFNMITGYYVPTTGEIAFDGQPIVIDEGQEGASRSSRTR